LWSREERISSVARGGGGGGRNREICVAGERVYFIHTNLGRDVIDDDGDGYDSSQADTTHRGKL
jgi:hypothetical protein